MGNKKNIISTEKAPAAVGAYSQGVEWDGVVYFSGQIGLDPATTKLRPGFTEQLGQILKNIDALLECQQLKREDIIKTTIFMTDLKDFAAVNQAYESYFTAPFPARSCVQVSALPKGAEIEIEVIAVKK